MQTQYVQGQPVEFGDLKAAILVGVAGPTSYSIATGDPVYNPAPGDYIAAPTPTVTVSKRFLVQFFPASAGDIRAGSPSSMQSGWTALWQYSGNLGVTVVQNAAGSGMTPGAVANLVFAGGTGGSGAAGYVTALSATVIAITVTNPGSGYTAAPTATVTGLGGTQPTFTVAVDPGYGPVANTTNLSGETLQFGALITER